MLEVVFKTEVRDEAHKQELTDLLQTYKLDKLEIKNYKFLNDTLYVKINVEDNDETRTS